MHVIQPQAIALYISIRAPRKRCDDERERDIDRMYRISIRAPRKRCDGGKHARKDDSPISIRAPRKRCDITAVIFYESYKTNFNPRTS